MEWKRLRNRREWVGPTYLSNVLNEHFRVVDSEVMEIPPSFSWLVREKIFWAPNFLILLCDVLEEKTMAVFVICAKYSRMLGCKKFLGHFVQTRSVSDSPESFLAKPWCKITADANESGTIFEAGELYLSY